MLKVATELIHSCEQMTDILIIFWNAFAFYETDYLDTFYFRPNKRDRRNKQLGRILFLVGMLPQRQNKCIRGEGEQKIPARITYLTHLLFSNLLLILKFFLKFHFDWEFGMEKGEKMSR